ncbi:MAG: ankyrin repeat domain-containing protein, partial [Rickettsiaceae bacterium]|nr:ankyrin repeat domain-containing protein [Rickettsiaceae bacterium]
IDVVKYLIESGADFKAARQNGITPLHAASQGGHLDVVKYLIECGASVDISLLNSLVVPDYSCLIDKIDKRFRESGTIEGEYTLHIRHDANLKVLDYLFFDPILKGHICLLGSKGQQVPIQFASAVEQVPMEFDSAVEQVPMEFASAVEYSDACDL